MTTTKGNRRRKRAIKRLDQKRIQALLDMMPPVRGEIRSVNQCGDCGHLFGHRYIPYSLGRGMTVDLCMCQITSHRPFSTIKEVSP